MVDIQSATAEIRWGKKDRKKETTGWKYNGLPYYKRRLEPGPMPNLTVTCMEQFRLRLSSTDSLTTKAHL